MSPPITNVFSYNEPTDHGTTVILRTRETRNADPLERLVPYSHAHAMMERGSFHEATILDEKTRVVIVSRKEI